MTQEGAIAVVDAAIAKGVAKHTPDSEREAHELRRSEAEALARIYSTELSDWVVQIAWLAGDKRWDEMQPVLLSANLSMQKLAGAVSKLVLPPKLVKSCDGK